MNEKEESIIIKVKKTIKKPMTRLELLDAILKVHSIESLSSLLNIATGTVKRWIELKNIPSSYLFDLMKVLNMKIDYSLYSFKEKDQFFTPETTASYCFQQFLYVLTQYQEKEEEFHYIEPSAGNGSFLKILPKDRTTAIDIEPRHNDILKADFLNWTPVCPNNPDKKYVLFGNPPFGLRGHTALRFIKHGIPFSDYICFLLPPLFESDGKGVPRKRIQGMNLIHSEKINTEFYYPDQTKMKVNVIFQIWSKYHTNETWTLIEKTNKIVKIFSLSDGGTSSTTRNKDMLYKCDVYLPSTCFGKENMRCYKTFDELPGKKGYGLLFYNDKIQNIDKALQINWTQIAFLSTNSAYNLRSSQIYDLFI